MPKEKAASSAAWQVAVAASSLVARAVSCSTPLRPRRWAVNVEDFTSGEVWSIRSEKAGLVNTSRQVSTGSTSAALPVPARTTTVAVEHEGASRRGAVAGAWEQAAAATTSIESRVSRMGSFQVVRHGVPRRGGGWEKPTARRGSAWKKA